jgi:hypothetical protein
MPSVKHEKAPNKLYRSKSEFKSKSIEKPALKTPSILSKSVGEFIKLPKESPRNIQLKARKERIFSRSSSPSPYYSSSSTNVTPRRNLRPRSARPDPPADKEVKRPQRPQSSIKSARD